MRGRALEVGPWASLRLICHCVDCQTFGRYLQAQGYQGLPLDDWGGTEIVQLPHGRIELEEGAEQLACVRLSPNGLMRWYAGCCHTPIANTLAHAKLPFAGLILSFVGVELGAGERDELLGPVRARVNGKPELMGPSAPPVSSFPLGVILRSIRILMGGWVRREHWPTPFFDAEGEPRGAVKVLDEEERERLRGEILGVG